MFQYLFRILIKPKDTLDRLLFEENMGQSWAATWLIVLVGACSSAITLLVQGRSRAPGSLSSQLEKVMPSLHPETLLSVGIVLFVGVSIVGYLLARLLFPWYVRMGLRMVAGDVYPKSREERRAKGRLVRLLHPYTMGIYVLPGFVFGLVNNFIMANQPAHASGQNVALVVVSSLLQLVTSLITLCFTIYMIVVRVIAIRKIYQVSAAQAFWGPFLIYFFTWFLFVIVLFVVIMVIVLLSGPHLHSTM